MRLLGRNNHLTAYYNGKILFNSGYLEGLFLLYEFLWHFVM